MTSTPQRVLRLASVLALLGSAAVVAEHFVQVVVAQSGLSLVTSSNLVYQGAFRLPRSNNEFTTYAYGGTGLSYRASNNSLIVVAHDWHQWVGEVTVPTPATASVVTGLPTAVERVTPRDILAGGIGLVNPGSPNAKKIGGTYPMPDGSLLVTAYDVYDGGGTSAKSHFSVSAAGAVSAPYLVGNAGFTSGWMLPIPAEWQSSFGAPAMTGNCCLSVIGRTSVGPSVTLFDPSVRSDQLNATMVLGYPLDHATLGKPEAPTDLYAMTSIIRGAAFVAGSRSVLFFGVHGTTSCYGGGTSDPSLAGTKSADGVTWCYDPTSNAKGSHGYPYVSRVWAYDANDLVAVKQGTKQPWEVLPYTTWTFDLPFQGEGRVITGVGYDAASQRLFIGSQYGDSDGYPLIHVFHVANTANTTTNDTTAPSVSLTAPAGGSTISGTTTLTASAADNVGVAGVWFSVDGTTVGSEISSSPFALSWNSTSVANGVHTVRATARDAAGNTTSSNPVSVTVSNAGADLTAPTVSVTGPTGGSAVSGTVTLSATASDNVGVVGVRFTVDGGAVGAEDTTAPYTYSWPTTSSTNGSRVIRAIARDAAGNSTTSSAVTVTVANTPSDTTVPTVSITAPASGSAVSGTVTVGATAADNAGVAGVRFTLDGATLGTEDTAAPYALSWTTTSATNGTHTLRAVARDTAGNTSTSGAVVVTVNNTTGDTTLPTVALTAPASGATVSGTTSLSASASDNVGVVAVQFTLDGVNLGAEDPVAPYTLLWTTTATANGTHTLRAVARDAAGNTRTSTARTVTVNNLFSDTAAPSVTLTAPAANATVAGTVTLTATSSDNVGVVGVQFAVDGVDVGAEDTSAPYTRAWSALSDLNGAHVLTATARDAAGNRRTTSVTVTLRNLGSGIAGDLDDDRVPDLLFEHTNGQLYAWLMTGATMTGQSALSPGAVNPIWYVVALDDFDGDRKTDILWQNTVTGQVYLWLMDQGTLVGEASILADSSPWRVMGTADLNGDGNPDILWKQPTTGELAVWYMHGTTFGSSAALGQVDPNWRLAGTADLNKDGQPDFVWQNRATGQLAYWLMNGATLQQAGAFTPGATNVLWEVRAVGDFDRDGQTDLVFQHATTGQLYIWYLNGTTLTRDTFLSPAQVDPNWRVVGTR